MKNLLFTAHTRLITQFIICLFFILACLASNAQNLWTQSADFPATARRGAVGFSIGDKGYIGTGSDGINFKKDLWEFDATSEEWSQRADLPGTSRDFAVGFSIGSLGYVGTGAGSGDNRKDFWQYDPVLNTWTQKADFGGGKRYAATGFSIGDKGYIGTGYDDGSIQRKDFYEYDPAMDTWTKKANVGGTGRWFAVSFVIDQKGYIGTAKISDPLYKNDLWEYDPLTDTWTEKATMPGVNRAGAAAFAIGQKGYVVGGLDAENDVALGDVYEYDPATDSWTQKADLAGSARYFAVAFAIGNKGYIGTGEHSDDNYLNDFWEYTPDCNVPAGLTSTNVKSNSARVNWNIVPGAQTYSVRYRKNGTMPWTKTTTQFNYKKLTGLSPITKYNWSVKSVCDAVSNVSSDWSAIQNFTTKPLKLENESEGEISIEVFPNPFSTSATLSFSLKENSHVVIEIFDLAGRKVKTIADENFDLGFHQMPLTDFELSTGAYFLRLKYAMNESIAKLIVE